MIDGIIWLVKQLAFGFYNLGYALTHPGMWLDWSNKENLLRFVYYGGSMEFLFVVLDLMILLTIAGIVHKPIMWWSMRIFEAIGNGVGRIAAWAGLIMVLQQIIIVFVQRIFAQAQIAVGFGPGFAADVSWWSEELKLFNAIVVGLCVAYAFIQGSHVRVDLVYGGISYRKKKIVDMFGAVFFMMPVAFLSWMYAWYFMWRHLITPKVSASDKLELMLRKARIVKWNVESYGFSPNGFNAYFLFKILMCAFIALVLIQALAFFYRSLLELREGEEAEGRYLDRDSLGAGEEAFEGTH